MDKRPSHFLSNFMTNAVMVSRGKKFSYEGRLWMPALFDTRSRHRVFKMSRQVGKSVSEAAEAVARCALIDNFGCLHVSPSQKQSRKFSNDKVAPIIKESPVLSDQANNSLNNVHERGFKRGGKFYIEYAKDNPDRCRGITTDMVMYDEVQDQNLDLIQGVINAALFTSEYKLRVYAGTPKSLDNGIEMNLWANSDQREWLVRCDKHVPAKWIKIGYRNIGLKGPTCHHCGGLLDVNQGQWVVTNPDGYMAGFHVNQIHCKISHATEEDWHEILIAKDGPIAQFHNEILGESFDSADKPLTLSALKNACDESVSGEMKMKPIYFKSERFAGIDWGHGDSATVIFIGQFDPDNPMIFRFIFSKMYIGAQCKESYCVPDMVNIMKFFGVSRAHCDYGGGFGLNESLSQQFGEGRVTTNYYSDTAAYADHKWSVKHELLLRITVNRSKAVSSFINKIRKGMISFQSWSVFHPEYSQHFLNIRKEVDSKDVVRFIRIGQDDAFHAALYCYTVARAVNG